MCKKISFCYFDERSEEKSPSVMQALKISRYARNDNTDIFSQTRMVIILFIALLLANTIAFAKPPDWVNGQSNRFPDGLYLVGVGQANSRDRAKSDALASIAKIFRARIEQQTTDWEKYIQIESRGKTEIEQKKAMESLTDISTDKVIEGAQIIETAQDGAIYYALAVIDRLQAKASLTERITDFDEKINASIELARNTPDKLSRIKNYKRTINTFLRRDAANIDLQVISVKGNGIHPAVSLTKVAQEFDEWLAKNFSIDVKINGTNGPVVQQTIIESLLQEGFPVNDGSDTASPDLFVKGDVTLSPVKLPGKPFNYVRWCVDLAILETKGNKIVGVVQKSGREGHISAEEAEARAIRALQPVIIADVGGRIAEYFTGETKTTRSRPSSCARQ
jgi:hypothetical protein